MSRRGTSRRRSSSSSTKDDKDSDSEDTYSGEGEGSIEAWFEMDNRVARKARKIWGKLGMMYWEAEAQEIDLSTVIEVAGNVYNELIIREGKKSADDMWKWDEFWTVEYQQTYRDNIVQQIYDYVEECARGRFLKFIRERGPEKFDEIREGAIIQFGGATKAQVAIWERELDDGMPSDKGAKPFPDGCNMREKLDQLESRRNLLSNICPRGKRSGYKYANNPNLTRMVIKLCRSYKDDIAKLVGDSKLRAEIAGVEVPEDPGQADFSDEWLPAWKTLREVLIAAYDDRRLDDFEASSSIPSMAMASGARTQMQCWRCDQVGHRMDSSECPMFGSKKLGKCCPSSVRARIEGKGKTTPGGARGGSSHAKVICRDYLNHGYCRRGDGCRFKHVKNHNGSAATPGGKFDTDQAEKLTSMVIKKFAKKARNAIKKRKKDRKSSGSKKPKATESSDDDQESEEDDGTKQMLSFLMSCSGEHDSRMMRQVEMADEAEAELDILGSPRGEESGRGAAVGDVTDAHVEMWEEPWIKGEKVIFDPWIKGEMAKKAHSLSKVTSEITATVTSLKIGKAPSMMARVSVQSPTSLSAESTEEDCHEIVLDGTTTLALALHDMSDAGCDTDTPRFISTEIGDFIPGLLNKSKAATGGIVFNGCGGGQSFAGGVGPAALKTNRTTDGSSCYLVDPQGVWIKKSNPDEPSLRVFAQQRFKAMGLPLKQNHNGSKDDVLVCEHTGTKIKLETRNGILVLSTIKNAQALGGVENIELLIDDIAKGRHGPVVDGNLKRYQGASLATQSCRGRGSQVDAKAGRLLVKAPDCGKASKQSEEQLLRGGAQTKGRQKKLGSRKGSVLRVPTMGHAINDKNAGHATREVALVKRQRRHDALLRKDGYGTRNRKPREDLNIEIPVGNDVDSGWQTPSPRALMKGVFALLFTTMVVGATHTSMVFNEAKLDAPSRSRLWRWRLGHPAADVPVRASKTSKNVNCTHTLNEDWPIQQKAKFRKQSFARNELATVSGYEPFWRVYADGYGGQESMGPPSYEGAIGGFVFVCAGTGTMKKKLYSSEEQFPELLMRYFIWVESMHYQVHQLVVDIKSTMISKRVEKVCADFHVQLLPISEGTPQELKFAEKAVGDLRRISRAMTLGAPHLPKWVWGLADEYATYVHFVIPFSIGHERGTGRSPYESVIKRVPDLRAMFVKVFGCPVQYRPAKRFIANQSKNDEQTYDGWFVGIQWPMVLVLRKSDMKVISVSRKLVVCYEGSYALPPDQCPVTKAMASIQLLDDEQKEEDSIPQSVQAAKALHEPNLADYLKEDLVLSDELASNPLEGGVVNQGESLFKPELQKLDDPASQKLANEIVDAIVAEKSKPEIAVELINRVKKILDAKEATGKVLEGNVLPKKQKHAADIDTDNILDNAKRRKISKKLQQPAEGVEVQEEVDPVLKAVKPILKPNAPLYKRPMGTRVCIESTMFDGDEPGSYSKDHAKWSYGTMVKKGKAGIVYVRWDVGDDLTKSHWSHLKAVGVGEKKTAYTVMAMVVEGAALKYTHGDEKLPYPKYFFECLVRKDWRRWVEAVQKENEGWISNGAYIERDIKDVDYSFPIIPLSELYSIKRDGRYKLRQIAMGNMLSKDKGHFYDTWSTAVSAEGIRWFYSLACACAKRVFGLDVATAYLQSNQRTPLYAYKPSHAGFSEMSMTELAELRAQLLKLVEQGGPQALKRLCRKMKNTKGQRSVWELRRAVYGVPDAGQAFAGLMTGVMVNDAGMKQAEVEPSIYIRIEEDDNGNLLDYVIAITWTDDVRYFGTDAGVKKFQDTMCEKLKCEVEGESEEFVSLETTNDLDNGTLEIKQPKYWVAAAETFKMYFKDGIAGMKPRRIPVPEGTKCQPATDEEFEEAKHLPMQELLGTLGFPAMHTKLEIRHSVSMVQRHAHKWSLLHFKLALNILEYGYHTREIGLMFSRGLDENGVNILYAYADSNFEAPQSHGCSTTMMNGAAIAFRSKKDTTTSDSTMEAEFKEAFHASRDIAGLRNLMSEVGLHQVEATILNEDNKPAISVAENKGSLLKKSKSFDIAVYSLRNRIEDQEIKMRYTETIKMIADLGTKSLGVKQFEFLRDLLNGYAIVRASGRMKSNALPAMVISMEELKTRK